MLKRSPCGQQLARGSQAEVKRETPNVRLGSSTTGQGEKQKGGRFFFPMKKCHTDIKQWEPIEDMVRSFLSNHSSFKLDSSLQNDHERGHERRERHEALILKSQGEQVEGVRTKGSC